MARVPATRWTTDTDVHADNVNLMMTQIEAEIDDAVARMADKSTEVEKTLLSASWVGGTAPYTYNLTVEGVTATSNQEVLPLTSVTEEQLLSLQGANIQDGGQSVGAIVLKAFGEKPLIDLPIRIILRGDA